MDTTAIEKAIQGSNKELVPKLALRVEESAYAIGTSINTVRRLIRNGRLRTVRDGKRIFVPVSAIREFLGE